MNSTERALAYSLSFSDLAIRSFHSFSTVATTSAGTPFGMKMPKPVATEGTFLTQLVIGGIVPKPSISSGWSADHRQRAQALALDHLGLLGRELRGDLRSRRRRWTITAGLPPS